MDFATEIAYPLPTIVIAEMLGVPTSDRPLFKRWADGLLRRQLSDAEFFRPEEEQRKDPEFQRLMHTFEEMSVLQANARGAQACATPGYDERSARGLGRW